MPPELEMNPKSSSDDIIFDLDIVEGYYPDSITPLQRPAYSLAKFS